MVETATVSCVAHYPGVDWAQCLALADNNEGLANELLSMFTGTLAEDVAVLNAAFEQRDYSALKDQAHKMHGALCYCAIPDMKTAMCGLETACIEVSKDPARAEDIAKAYGVVKQELDAFLAYIGKCVVK